MRENFVLAGAIAVALTACASHSTEISLPPQSSLARDAENHGDWAAAARHWEAASAAAPGDRSLTLAAARALRLSNACGRAARYHEQLERLQPNDFATLLEVGKCHLVSGRYDAAETTFQRATVINPNSWEAETALATTYDLIERPADALPHHDRALALAADNPTVLSNAGLSRALAGDLPAGLTLMRKAAAAPQANARVRMNLAFLEALSGHGDVAAMMARQESSDDDATIKILQRIASAHR